MIHTPKKQKRWKDRHPVAYKNLVHYSIILLLLLAAVIALQPEKASGEAPIIVTVTKNIEKQVHDTNQDKIAHIAVLGQPEPISVTGDVDKEALKALIIKEAEKSGYKAPLFATRIVQCESNFNPSAIGDHGQSYGMWQIHLPSHPTITKQQALDPQWSTEWAMKQLAAGHANIWTCTRILS